MNEGFGIVETNGKFIVTQDKKPIRLPKSDGASIVTEFDCAKDAETYILILKRLRRKTAHV